MGMRMRMAYGRKELFFGVSRVKSRADFALL
jgi:hypothetical protein